MAVGMDRRVRIVKRCLDLAGAAIGLALCAPLFPVIAAAVKLDSPGPALFRQRRAGKLLGRDRVNGESRLRFVEFEILKFRTMRADAEKGTGAVLAERDDPRATRLGRFLRRTRLDELPQLWCVLRGDMSLVGPRPERPELLANYALAIPLFEERMRDVKPGITGFAQVNLGYSGDPPPDSEIARLRQALVNPWKLDGVDDSEADGMRLKLLYDLAYGAQLDDLWNYLRTEAEIILRTPLVMLKAIGQ
jgi:lipopolysaccharide/colanic/teichoic acid biosynthesis glycosyltransferase